QERDQEGRKVQKNTRKKDMKAVKPKPIQHYVSQLWQLKIAEIAFCASPQQMKGPTMIASRPAFTKIK
ncbi:3914_t:CDS:2, partial [Dentiscutata heterogama]